MARGGERNYMDKLHDVICAIKNTKPEIEMCNARCPPFGCPKGPFNGMCCYYGRCDTCCVSRMPCYPPPPEAPNYYTPPCLTIARTETHRIRPHSTTARRPLPTTCPHHGAGRLCNT